MARVQSKSHARTMQGECVQRDDIGVSSYEHVSTVKSHDESPDKHVRVGEVAEATTPCAPLKCGDTLVACKKKKKKKQTCSRTREREKEKKR